MIKFKGVSEKPVTLYPTHMMKSLIEREQNVLLRTLQDHFSGIDFCSNDYLGFSRLGLLNSKMVEQNTNGSVPFGANASHLISRNSAVIQEAEKQIALFHHAKSALIFNSGYDANLGLLSCVAQRTDLILYDEFVHASLLDGIKLSPSTSHKFQHNDLAAIEALLIKHQKNFENVFIVVESVYSLDGDSSPLIEITELCRPFKNVFLIVDEAHAIGVYGKQGRGLCNALNIESRCFARIYSYGKAMGCQGAVILGSEVLTNYLVNYARPFIYTTALPLHSINAILHAYQLLIETDEKEKLQKNIAYFYQKAAGLRHCVKSQSAIHSITVSSLEQAGRLQRQLSEKNMHVRVMKRPTFQPSSERVRICLHSFNTHEEIDLLVEVLSNFQ